MGGEKKIILAWKRQAAALPLFPCIPSCIPFTPGCTPTSPPGREARGGHRPLPPSWASPALWPLLSLPISVWGVGGVGGSFSPLFFGFVSSKADRKEEGGEGGNLLPTALVSHASACYLGARNEDTQSTLPLLPSLEDEGR